jgi:hypothetical protein
MTVYAEAVNFWQTSRSSSDTWISKAQRQIEELGGKVLGEGFGSDAEGRAAFMLGFSIGGDAFKIIWPVLTSKTKNSSAAKIQAATMMYHYVKSVCLYAVVVGARAAFFSHLILPDGRVASQVAGDEIAEVVPQVFLLPEPVRSDDAGKG